MELMIILNRFTYLESIVHQQHRRTQPPPPRPNLSSPRFPAASSGHWSELSGAVGGNSYRAHSSRNAAG